MNLAGQTTEGDNEIDFGPTGGLKRFAEVINPLRAFFVLSESNNQ